MNYKVGQKRVNNRLLRRREIDFFDQVGLSL
jgi:hypothetical protein